jgi:hypothetical protein
MAVAGLRTGAVVGLGDGERQVGGLQLRRCVYADMVVAPAGRDGPLSADAVMDLFEESRTQVIGGQSCLKAFKERGLLLVVGRIDQFALADGVSVAPGADVTAEVTLLRTAAGRRCFHFTQRLLRDDGVELARAHVLLCSSSATDGALVPIAEETWEEWTERLRAA